MTRGDIVVIVGAFWLALVLFITLVAIRYGRRLARLERALSADFELIDIANDRRPRT